MRANQLIGTAFGLGNPYRSGGPGERAARATEDDMATHLKLYTPAPDVAEAPPEPDVRVRLSDLIPVITMAQRMNFIWLKDFMDDEIAISRDLYEVMQAFASSRPTSA
jgi:hypothetical protein